MVQICIKVDSPCAIRSTIVNHVNSILCWILYFVNGKFFLCCIFLFCSNWVKRPCDTLSICLTCGKLCWIPIVFLSCLNRSLYEHLVYNFFLWLLGRLVLSLKLNSSVECVLIVWGKNLSLNLIYSLKWHQTLLFFTPDSFVVFFVPYWKILFSSSWGKRSSDTFSVFFIYGELCWIPITFLSFLNHRHSKKLVAIFSLCFDVLLIMAHIICP